MGYLTTVTIYNDGISLLNTCKDTFAEKLYQAACRGKETEFGVGSFANFAHVQESRHADDHTTYVHMGNCVTEVNPYSKGFKELIEKNPEFAKDLVDFMDGEVKALKRLIKKEEKGA